MNWQDLEQRIRTEIQPGHRGILKCKGDKRRPIISNDGHKIAMRTGVETNTAHTISYKMIQYAFERLSKNGALNSADFRARFGREYKNATCRYSMVGGVLVEMGVAQRHPIGNSCYYTKSED
jgi:hypothetical protein